MASPIDEIFIKLGFKTDDKDIDKTKKKVDDLLDNTDKKSKKADISFNKIFKTVRRMAVAAGATYIAFDRLANSMLKSNQAYINFNRQTGLALANVNKIAGAGMLVDYNLNPENVMGSMQALESNLAQIRLGEGNIAPFQLLGISPVGKNAVQVIEDLRQAIKGIDDMTATNIIQQMGLSPEMLTILRMSREEMEQYSAIANQYLLNPKQRHAMQQYAMGLRLVHMEFNYLKDTLILRFMPTFIELGKQINERIKNLEYIIEMFQNIQKEIPALKLAIAGLATFILAKFHPVLLAITSLFLLLDDLAVWKMGGKSMTGILFGDYKSKENQEKTTDELYEKAFGTKRTGFNKYADWIGQGGFIGTLVDAIIKKKFPNHKTTPEFYQDLLRSYIGNNSNNTFTQNNYITTSKEITQDMAKVLPLMMSKEINKLSIDSATLQINTAY